MTPQTLQEWTMTRREEIARLAEKLMDMRGDNPSPSNLFVQAASALMDQAAEIERLRQNGDEWKRQSAENAKAADDTARERDDYKRKLDEAKEIILACMPILRVEEFYKLEDRCRAFFSALTEGK